MKTVSTYAAKGSKMQPDPFLHQPDHLQKYPVQPKQKFVVEVVVTIPSRRSNGGYTKTEIKRGIQGMLDNEFTATGSTASCARVRTVDLD